MQQIDISDFAPQKHDEVYEHFVQLGKIPDLDYTLEGSFEVVSTDEWGKLDSNRVWFAVEIKSSEQEKGTVWAFCEIAKNMTPHRDWKFVDSKETAYMMVEQIERGIL